MKEWLHRWKNRIMSLFTIAVVLVSVLATSFVSSAATHEFYLQVARPTTSSNQGYLELLMFDSLNQRYFPRIYFWSTYAVNSDGSLSPTEGYWNLSEQSVEFNVYTNQGATSVMYSLCMIEGLNGDIDTLKHSSTAKYSNTFSSNITVIDWNIYGSGYVVTGIDNQVSWSVHYSEESDALLLRDIYDALMVLTSDGSRNLQDLYAAISRVKVAIENGNTALAGKLTSIYEEILFLSDISSDISDDVQAILDILQKTENTEDIDPEQIEPDKSVTDMKDKENAVKGDATVDDFEGSMEVQIDSGANESIWNIVERFVTANGTVFGAYISLLTLGAVCLILNR